MVGWHHRLNGHEFEQTPGFGDVQGSLVCYSPWCLKESNMTEQLNQTEMLAKTSSAVIVRYSSGEAEKERQPQQKQTTFIQARRGDSWPNDQAERRKGSGRLHSYREVWGSYKGNNSQEGFEYSSVEMTLVVGQGVISLLGGWRGWQVSGQGEISPRQMQLAWSIRMELKLCFVFSEVR